ncbi:MAG: hypothetical protein WCH99_05145 [Verrucomicrobiota bacterium]
MNPNQLRPWWLRKRIVFPFMLIVGVAIAGVVAFVNSDTSTIVVYNETGNPLPPLLVRACGQQRSLSSLAERESVQFALKSSGGETAVCLELATNPAWKWEGQSIKPHGGYRVSIRLWPDRQVEAYTEISWLQQTFGGK